MMGRDHRVFRQTGSVPLLPYQPAQMQFQPDERDTSQPHLKRVAINAIQDSQISRCVILLRATEERAHGQTTSNGVA